MAITEKLNTEIEDRINDRLDDIAREITALKLERKALTTPKARLISELLGALRHLEAQAGCIMCGGMRYPLTDRVTGKTCDYNFHFAMERAAQAIEAAGAERA